MSLTFRTLRLANMMRVGVFKNTKGEPAHKRMNGSDWTVAEWLQAFMGEVGEFARERWRYEQGIIGPEEYERRAAKELADIQIYLDLMAARALDSPPQPHPSSRAAILLKAVMHLGEYAELSKKHRRGDIDYTAFRSRRLSNLAEMNALMDALRYSFAPDDVPGIAHPDGIDLAEAVRAKFNEVSDRIGHPEIKI